MVMEFLLKSCYLKLNLGVYLLANLHTILKVNWFRIFHKILRGHF